MSTRNVGGYIIYSNATTFPINLVPGDLDLLDGFLNTTVDNASNTFTAYA